MTTETVLTDTELRQLQGEHLNTIGSRDARIASCIKAGRAIEQAVLQSPEIQALRKDAERYRYLRSRPQCENRDAVSISLHEGNRSGRYVSGVDADFAIDAAMEKQP